MPILVARLLGATLVLAGVGWLLTATGVPNVALILAISTCIITGVEWREWRRTRGSRS